MWAYPALAATAVWRSGPGDNTSEVADMSRYGVFMALVLSGLVVLSACSSAKPAAPAGGTGSVSASVHIGRYTQVFASPLPANPAQSRVVEGFRQARFSGASRSWRGIWCHQCGTT
jgi:hypothetical protein